jgi:hypothetical protein
MASMYDTSGSRSAIIVVVVLALSASLFFAMTYGNLPTLPFGNDTLTTTTTTTTTTNTTTTTTTVVNESEELTPHAPIQILSNADFAGQAAEEGWAGEGSLQSPYIITGYEIETTGTCIWIENVTSHFVISNCRLSGASEWTNDWGNAGIHLSNTQNGIISNNGILVDLLGMHMHNSSYILIDRCDIFGALAGANITDTDDSVIQLNTFRNNTISLGLFWCDNVTLLENVIYGNMMELGIFVCTDIILWANSYFANYAGIWYESIGGMIADNIIAFNDALGLRLFASTSGVQIIANQIGFNIMGNARDDGSENQWDDGLGWGNFWSDYEGGGEVPYIIPGTAGSVDNYPFTLTEEQLPSYIHP